MGNTLYVTMLGGFSLAWPERDGPGVTAGLSQGAQQMWTLLAYLCVHHDREVPEAELVQAVWGDDRVVDPSGSLSALLQRARAELEKLGFPNGRSVLLYRRNSFAWVPGLEFCLDVEELDRICAEFTADPEKALPAALELLPRCQGEFLPHEGRRPWVTSLRTRCRGRCLRLLRGTADLLGGKERYAEAIRLCRTATAMDPFDEDSQVLLMKLLDASGSAQSALWHYKSLTRLYADQLGAAPPAKLESCYRELLRSGQSEELDLRAVRRQLAETDNLARPLFCGYAAFQTIYQLIARSIPRTGLTAQLALLDVEGRDGEQLTAAQCEAAMGVLRSAGLSQLREGDVCTRLSVGQYLLLLPSASREDARMTLTRCLSAFEKTPAGRAVSVHTGVEPVEPIEV